MLLDDLVGANGFRIEGTSPLGDFGLFIVAGFDWNHDDVDDLAIAEPEAFIAGRGFAGRVTVIFGHPAIGVSGEFDVTSLDGSNGFTVIGPDLIEGLMGRSLAVGEYNGDTWSDLAIGAPGNGLGGREGAGEIFVLFGGPGVGAGGVIDIESIDGVNGFRIIGENAHDVAHVGLGVIGDVNGDGIDDIGAGSDRVDALGRVDAGRCYVIFGSPAIGAGGLIDLRELAYPEGFVINGADTNDGAYFIRGGGDVNGDGYGDLTVGTRGELYVLYGSPGIGSAGPIDLAAVAWPQGVKLRILNNRPGSGIIGDINHDNYDDLAVAFAGAWLFIDDEPFNPPFNPRQGAGRVSVVYGAPDLGINGPILAGDFDTAGDLDGENGFGVWGDDFGRNLGTYVFALGDVNHDGVDDFGAKVNYSRTDEDLPAVDGLYVIHGRRKFAVADFDLDGDVDMRDFMDFAMCYGGADRPPAGSCPDGVNADFDDDNDVDTGDFAIFAQNFTGSM